MSEENKAPTRPLRMGRGFGPPGGGPGGPGGGEKAKDFKGSTFKLLGYMKRYHAALIMVFLCAVGSTVFSIIGPKILGNATTEIYNGLISKLQGGNGIDFGAIANILILLIVLYTVSACLSLIMGFLMTNITQKTSYRMREELSAKIHRMPMGYFEGSQHGEVLSVVTNDVDTLTTGLNQSATQLITAVCTIIGVLIMMFSINWVMTLVAVVIMPISAITVSIVVKKSQKYFRGNQEYLGHINGTVEETFSGIQVVQAFNNEETVIAEFEASNKVLHQAAWKSQFFSGLMQPIMGFIGNLGYVAVAILGGWFAATGRITVGNIQSFIQYNRNFTQPIAQIAQVSSMLQSTAAAAERVFAFLALVEENQKAAHHAPVTLDEITGAVTFDHVRFGYKPDVVVIKDFSAEIAAGRKIAIVGPTGAGKTTLVKLLMRFYDVTDGKILVDGYDVRNFDRTELRELFGMVLQDTWLFTGTIMENIRYGRLDATDEEVRAAAKAAHADHFIQALPGGYNMELGEDAASISQGQRQLLTIARAILADNRIMILDEATSSVDTRTEVLIQKAMDNLTVGRTSFIIAHRLSTIRNADLILVIREGDIVEQGNHGELLEKDGFYADLYNSQFEKMDEAI